ncbi:transposase [Streptomyces sp. NPDC059340]|uniref:IS110 family transposase n=1 Tax=Streptomyces sp. NPDC059340 TaxID=3346806 RepID=UPI0036952DF8
MGDTCSTPHEGTHHHCAPIDESGRRLPSRRVAHDEPEMLELRAAALALGDELAWGIGLNDGGAALPITILLNHDQLLAPPRFHPHFNPTRSSAGSRYSRTSRYGGAPTRTSRHWSGTSAPGSGHGTRIPSPSPGRRPQARSSNASPDM